MKKYSICIVIFHILLCVSLPAKTIGVFCVHGNDLFVESQRITAVLETALFDMCFDNGIIVTNVENEMTGYESYKNNFLLNKSLASVLDYLTVIYCDYEKNDEASSVGNVLNWNTIYCKLIDFSSERIVFEKEIPVALNHNKDIIAQAYSMGQAVGQIIVKEILNNAGTD